MKKHLLIALVLSLAWPVSAAPADQAVAKQLLVTQFQQIKDDAAQCREAVRKQNFKKAISLGQRALTKETEALALAKKNNIRVTFGQVYGSDGFLPDPLTNYVDVAENVLFSRVMSGEISLREALRCASRRQRRIGLQTQIKNCFTKAPGNTTLGLFVCFFP